MDASYFARGLAIGFAIAAPVGAIGLLCIRRTLASGRLVGFMTGLGAATADAFYGAVAALGLTAISAVHHRPSRFGSAGWRAFSLLSGRAHSASRTGHRDKLERRTGIGFRLQLDGRADAHQSDDDSLVRRGLCRTRTRYHGQRSRLGYRHDRGGLPRLGFLVAAAQWCRRIFSPRTDDGATALGKPSLRRGPRRLWNTGASQFESLKIDPDCPDGEPRRYWH